MNLGIKKENKRIPKKKVIEKITETYEKGQLERELKEDVQITKTNFEMALQMEKTKFANNGSADYYIVMYFQDGEQVQEFLKKSNSAKLLEGCFVAGEDFAKNIGIELEQRTEKRVIKPFKKSKHQGKTLGLEFYNK